MNFLKTFFASLFGTIIGISLLFLIFFAALMSGSTEPEPYIRSGTVLSIELSGNIPARTVVDPFQKLFSATASPAVSLEMLQSNLEKAAVDDNISGVWLKMNNVTASWAHLETAYSYFETFKESGKFLYASTDDIGLNENAYFLASAADSIFSPPVTWFEFNGFLIQNSYYKNLLDKIGVQPEIMRVGRYKSAVEQFTREDSSPEHREQVTAILDNASDTFIRAVQNKSGLTPEQIDSLMNDIPEDPVAHALEHGLIDVIALPAEIETHVKTRAGVEEDSSLLTVRLNRYNRVTSRSAGLQLPDTDNRIAVIYASGIIMPDISPGFFGNDPVITSAGMKEILDSILEDDDIKAIVLHINSPGGAATSSDLIWHHLKEASEEKPVVAYMGEVAASGGYYIAMGADTVITSPNSITGSIGIYSMLFNTRELYNDKLGITFENFKTHEHADIFQMTRPLTEFERGAIQRNVSNGYEVFLNRVSENRTMTRDEVHELAQGRVWTGSDAVENGLADMAGDLSLALDVAAGMAGIDEYQTVTYPEPKELFEILMGSARTKIDGWVMSIIPGSKEISTLDRLLHHNIGRNWALHPFEYIIE